jgi:hypothetical protein
MQGTLSYRHRVITDDDLVFIRQLIAEHPGSSRRDLSLRLCLAWNWVQANGALRDMVCRGLMLMLHRRGLIELPPVRQLPHKPRVDRTHPPRVSVDQAPGRWMAWRCRLQAQQRRLASAAPSAMAENLA